ncbi:Glucan endo-1,3-beta-glucosidase 8 [Acorus calamus]|uniref:glucan endo-1,3-beta-D-glucosidase n=1 Tax=Acorus calamus TaxID=4465 RepID=A0AAV9DDW9_ACOCL|nr:Glucan endo-1,3-beta-glucosidase 8 [Acorus calamus]
MPLLYLAKKNVSRHGRTTNLQHPPLSTYSISRERNPRNTSLSLSPLPFTMAIARAVAVVVCMVCLWSPWSLEAAVVDGLGVNWGSMSSHPMTPSTVVRMMKENGIKKVKLFDADPWTLGALAGSDMEVMVAIPNDMLARMQSYDNAKKWVAKNVTRYHFPGGVNIRYVAVGNEPFLKAYKGAFMNTTFPALKNIQKALDAAGLGDRIKATTPLNADVYNSPDSTPIPSAGNFRSDIRSLMTDIVHFLHSNSAPFVVNIYPFLSLALNPDFPLDFAFFDGGSKPITDGGTQYTNVFDANYDTLVHSLKKTGVPDMKIIVGEVGWPTDGVRNANVTLARRFYDGFLKKMANGKGTPLRPGRMDVYLFGLVDEDLKSILPGDFERHWGIFRYDGQPKFPMDLSGRGKDAYLARARGVEYQERKWCVFNESAGNARAMKGLLGGNVNYACSFADCTALNYGGSCNGLDARGKVSYAFNQYFQAQDQDVQACVFQGLASITTVNASVGECLFPVQIVSAGVRAVVGVAGVVVGVVVVAAALIV